MKHKSLTIGMSLAYPPISNHDFAFIRDEGAVQEMLKGSHLYMFAQRPQLVFDIQRVDTDNNIIHLHVRNVANGTTVEGVLPLNQQGIGEHTGIIDVEFGSHDREYKFEKPPFNNINGMKFYSGKEFLSWLSPERLIYSYSREKLYLDGMDGWGNLIDFPILYVGKSTDQYVYDRLDGHSTLQEILSKQMPLFKGSLPTHEIVLLLFRVHSLEGIEVLGNFKSIDDFTLLDEKEINDLYVEEDLVDEKVVSLDAEKLFVNLLDPSYNKVKFKSYPYSKDGLYKQNLSSYSYKILEHINLVCNGRRITGSTEHIEADTIVIFENRDVLIITPELT